jgi:branched-chain amino acid aminotransferase
MAHSAEVVSMPSVPESLFMECVHAAVSLNAAYVPPHETGASMYIRPLLFGSSPQLGLSPPDGYTFCVYVLPVGVYHGVHPVDALILEDFDRSAPNGTGNAKLGGNYAPVLRHSDKARTEGYDITLHLDSKTHTEIDEFSTSGFIGVKKNGEEITLVVPDSKAVIASVTSESCLEIGKTLGYKVERRSVSDFFSFEFFSSTQLIPSFRLNTRSFLPSPKSWQPAPLQHWFRSSPSPEGLDPKSSNTLLRTPKSQVLFSRSCSLR